MSLVPAPVVANVYRRYLKSISKIPNVTIRMLLLQQVRTGFRRNAGLFNPLAQRDLLSQAQKDLQILEDSRLQRTLYITKFGSVSCIDWELRRTEYHFSPKSRFAMLAFIIFGYSVIASLLWRAQKMEDAFPDIAKVVDTMALQLEADSEEEALQNRVKQVKATIETLNRQMELEESILSTFHGAPQKGMLPSLQNPAASRRYESNKGAVPAPTI
jgi:hypothetical protein